MGLFGKKERTEHDDRKAEAKVRKEELRVEKQAAKIEAAKAKAEVNNQRAAVENDLKADGRPIRGVGVVLFKKTGKVPEGGKAASKGKSKK